MEKGIKGKLFVITGPSGVGKGTILERFFKNNPRVVFSISSTTRNPRPGEAEGKNYFFIKTEEFQKAINNNEFLEWAQYSNNYYGTKKSFVLDNIENGNDVVLEIETEGAKKIMDEFPECVSIFLTPPNIKELEKRLRGRKTEDEESILRRLNKMNDEMELVEIYKYSIENDEVDNALGKLQAVYDYEKGISTVE